MTAKIGVFGQKVPFSAEKMTKTTVKYKGMQPAYSLHAERFGLTLKCYRKREGGIFCADQGSATEKWVF